MELGTDPAKPPAFEEISVVVPALNEVKRIRGSIEEIVGFLSGRFARFEVLLVDDGSTDGTSNAAASLGHPAVRVLRNETNRGKGASVRLGVLEARYDPILFTDADLSAPIAELEKLLVPLAGGSDVVVASRRLARSEVRRSLLRRILGWGFSVLVSLLLVRGVRDTQCGFKLFRRSPAREIFRLQTIDRWGFDPEILAIAQRRGLRIAEVPVRWTQSGETRVRLSTPFAMAWELVKIRWNDLRGHYGRRGRGI